MSSAMYEGCRPTLERLVADFVFGLRQTGHDPAEIKRALEEAVKGLNG